MAKDIKAVKCPQCGSVVKTAIKPDFYQCQSCGTEYFLDSDDIHIHHHHTQAYPQHSSSPPVSNKQPVFILIGAVLLIVLVYLAFIFIQPQKQNAATTYTAYKMPRMYYSSFVYTNTGSGEPVYLRLGTDDIDKGNNKTEKETHAQFNNALNGKLITDRILNEDGQTNKRCLLSFKTYSPQLIYAIGCNSVLYKLDTRNNELSDVTKSLFKDFPELSSGIARLEFDYYKPMMNLMSNDGKSYYYFPQVNKLLNSADQADQFWKKEFDNHYFGFGTMGDPFNHGNDYQLIENTYSKQNGKTAQRDVTPGRKYFDPKILYQDDTNILIVVNTTAASDSPVGIQRIDVKTGKLLWALAPDTYDLYSAAKWKNGFVVEYRRGSEADYVHGVLVIGDDGKMLYNYQLSRTE